MKLIKSIYMNMFPIIRKQSIKIHEQQQSIQERNAIIDEISAREKLLKSELQFIYSILIQREGCRLQLFPLFKQDTLLLAVDHKITQLNFYLYIPGQQPNEIAQAYTNVLENSIVIHELYVAASNSNIDFQSFLLYQIKSEANTLGMSVIYA